MRKKHILFTFLTLWLTFHPVVHFSTACSKIAWNVGPLCSRPIQAVPVASWLHKHS